MNKIKSRRGRALQERESKIAILSQLAVERKENIKHDLQQQAVQGEKAAIIAEYADKVLYDAENCALAELADETKDLFTLREKYRAALAFYQKVNSDIDKGLNAANKLKKILRQEQEEKKK